MDIRVDRRSWLVSKLASPTKPPASRSLDGENHAWVRDQAGYARGATSSGGRVNHLRFHRQQALALPVVALASRFSERRTRAVFRISPATTGRGGLFSLHPLSSPKTFRTRG